VSPPPSDPEPAPADPVGREVGGCRLLHLIGRGGMGSVYLAEQLQLARRVAVKLLDPDLAADPLFRDRFLLEARTAARVEHPNVVPIHDAGAAGDVLYLVLRYVAGGDLAAYAAGRRLPPDEVVGIGLAVARALAAAWAEGVVHLDIKPANVLRARSGEWQVTDFGLARQVAGRGPDAGGAADRAEEVSGTPPYMPLEQWEGREVDGRTDVFALGTTLYELLAGSLPYPHLDAAQGPATDWYRALRRELPAPLRRLAPDAPDRLVELVEDMRAREPGGRPGSAAAVVAELEALAGGPRGVSPGPRVDRAVARAPTAAVRSAPGAVPTLGAADTRGPGRPGGPSQVLPALVGRDEELAWAGDVVRGLTGEAARGGLLLLVGPGGVGRSRLLHEVGRLAAAAGALVLEGRGRSHQPLAAVRDLLRSAFGLDAAAGDPRERLRLELARAAGDAGIAQAVAVLEPLLLDDAPATGAAGPGDGELPVPYLVDLLAGTVEAARPRALLLDELEEADGATLELVRGLAVRSRRAPLLVAAACRDGDAGRAALERLADLPDLEPRAVAPLGPAELRRVARGALGPEGPPLAAPIVAALSAPADGLPKVPVAAAREALAQGAIERPSDGGDGGEADGDAAVVADLARAARARLDQSDRTVVLAAGAATPAERARAGAERVTLALRLRAFHDYGGAIAALRGALAELSPDDPAGRRATLELARTLRQAGRELEEAAALADGVAERLRTGGEPGSAAEAGLEGALALYLLRRYAEALERVDGAAEDLARARGDSALIEMSALAAAERVEAEAAHVRGLVLARLEGEGARRGAKDAFQAALRRAAAAGDQGLYARCAQSYGDMRLRLGDLDGAERLLRASARYKERRGDLPGLAIAYGSLARLARERGDLEGAAESYARDLAVAQRIGDARGSGVAANGLGEVLEERYLAAGDPADAERAAEAFDAAGEAARASGNALDDAIARFYRGRFLLRTGRDPEAGAAELRESAAGLRALGEEELAARAEAALAAGAGEGERAAAARWRPVEDRVAHAVGAHVRRLEAAMIERRRWSPAEARRVAEHPLLRRAARALVWGAYGADGALRATFRLDDGGRAVGADGAEVALDAEVRLGIVRGDELDPPARAAWAEALAKAGLRAPFRQL